MELTITSNSSGLIPLFTSDAYSEILEEIFVHIGQKDIARLLRVNKHINQVFTTSSKLQLSYRKSYHAIPLPKISNSPSLHSSGITHQCKVPISKELDQLLEQEERLNSLKPSSTQCLHVPNSLMFEFKSGYLLVGERLNKVRVHYSETGFRLHTWSIWDLSSDKENRSIFAKARGANKNQGFYKWRFDQGQNSYDTMSMCPEDNVIAVSRERNEMPCASIPEDSEALSLRRIYFYQLIPSEGTPTPPKGTFEGAIRHPEAAADFIEIRVPAKHHLHRVKVQVAPGGKVGILIKNPGNSKFNFLGFWDWKRGISLGKIAPSTHMTLAEDFRFFGNFVIVGVFREITLHEHFTDPKESKTELKKARTAASAKKIAQGYKVGGSKNGAGSRHNPKALENEDGRKVRKREELFFCIDSYELLNLTNGKRPSPFAHRAYTETGYNPSEPCTWDWEDIPTCSAITSHLLPAFNSSPNVNFDPLQMLSSGRRNMGVNPTSCTLGEVIIDDALLKGERDGVMTFDLYASIRGILTPDEHFRCLGTIDLRELIHRITTVLIDRIKSRDIDPEGHTIQTELATMWSNDPSVQKFLNRQLGFDQDFTSTGNWEEEGWETDPEEYSDMDEINAIIPGKLTLKDVAKDKSQIRKSHTTLKPGNSKMSSSSISNNRDTNKNKFYDKIPIFFKEWEKSCSLKFSLSTKPLASYGSKVFTADPNLEKIKNLPITTTMIPINLIMRDFNSNLLKNDNEDSSRLNRPLGGLTTPDSSSLDMKENQDIISNLSETKIGICKLTKPITLPKLNEKTFERVKLNLHSNLEDMEKIDYENMFEIKRNPNLKSELESNSDAILGFIESKIEFEWDSRRLLTEIFFEDDKLVLIMQNGATIMTFSSID